MSASNKALEILTWGEQTAETSEGWAIRSDCRRFWTACWCGVRPVVLLFDSVTDDYGRLVSVGE